MRSIILLSSFLVGTAMGLIGYDCGSKDLQVTTLSLLDVGNCEISEDTVNVTERYIQLLQIDEYSDVSVRQCKIEIKRTIYRCGMFSHVSIVSNGENEYLMEIGKQACDEAHITGILKVADNQVIQGLRINNTESYGIILAGTVNSDGKCDGEGYSDRFGSWQNVVVQAVVKVSLTEQVARVALNSNTVHLRSGTVCQLSEGKCIDQEGGYTFWKDVPLDNCNFNKFSILYEGIANKMIDQVQTRTPIVYSVSTQEITFALTAKGKEYVCGYTIIKTEHPKLVIFETTKGDGFALKKTISVSNLDIFAYVNSKFIYVEKHIKSQMKSLYIDVITQKCKVERETLKNSLSLATQAPDEFAYDIMKEPGHMAVVAGEVVHIVKCAPVEVKVEHGIGCYSELQVVMNKETYFLTPRTHILKKKGTEITCNRFLPSYYRVDQKWYKILPLPTEATTPKMVKPMTNITWEYSNPGELATTGIYSQQEINQLRDRIMFPVEKPSVLNDLAREIQGHSIINPNEGILKLFNENVVEKFVQSTWKNFWNKFVTFGTVSAGIIAILMIIQIIKMVIDIIIQGFALHSVYGWSIHLLGAVWSSISHLLIRLGEEKEKHREAELRDVKTRKKDGVAKEEPKETELREVKIVKEAEVLQEEPKETELREVKTTDEANKVPKSTAMQSKGE